ncbi:MAG: 3-deoxy-D-manno-octulosonic acid transferase [Desulfobacterales bacterium]|nr:3-deoxy-D-manno-octulosonic acid transferase [Desulfobacterales bacterium]
MKFLYAAYLALTSGLFVSCLPPFWIYTRLSGRYRKGFGERLGFVPRTLTQCLAGSPRIWIHAVSLGEVKVAAPLVKALKRMIPGCSIIISTITEHGRDLAMETFGEDTPVIYAPLDFIGSVRKALFRVCPDILVFLETEIWPAWIAEAQRMGIKTALINGRISVRSIGGYLKFRPLFREVLKNVDAFSMILEEDAARIRMMGADPQKIEINGNAKYDLLPSLAGPAIETEMRQILNLDASHQVFVAGSTREGEEVMVLDAYEKILKEFPDTILIIAPRHINRTPVIGSMVEGRGFRYQRRSGLQRGKGKRTEPVVIVNTFGELFEIYSVGTVAFCGASLVPLGGQNPLEVAIWGKVVFYGPSMENFVDAKALLEKVGAGIPVSNSEMLAEKAIWFLSHPDALRRYGARARKAVIRKQNAAEKHARVIRRLVLERLRRSQTIALTVAETDNENI